MEELENSYIESNFTREYQLKLGGSAIEMEFSLLSILLEQSKTPGFVNILRDHREYIESRFNDMARFMLSNE